jgi:hypothetical protein
MLTTSFLAKLGQPSSHVIEMEGENLLEFQDPAKRGSPTLRRRNNESYTRNIKFEIYEK